MAELSHQWIIQARNVGKNVALNSETLHILHGVNLEIKQGESLAIIGRSGSGKTTLLGLLAGMDVPTEGRVMINGHNLATMSEDQRAVIRAQYTGFVFQSFQLIPTMTALENVMLPLELKKLKNGRSRARELLASVGLSGREGHYPSQLSGGEQQRVSIARAFACEPKLLFADEPTGSLDSETGEQIIRLLFELNNAHGTTLVLVTHDDVLANRCDRQLYLKDGRVV